MDSSARRMFWAWMNDSCSPSSKSTQPHLTNHVGVSSDIQGVGTSGYTPHGAVPSRCFLIWVAHHQDMASSGRRSAPPSSVPTASSRPANRSMKWSARLTCRHLLDHSILMHQRVLQGPLDCGSHLLKRQIPTHVPSCRSAGLDPPALVRTPHRGPTTCPPWSADLPSVLAGR